MKTSIVFLGGFAAVAHGFKVPFISDLLNFGLSHGQVSNDVVSHKIAIIGAGAGGSSAAFWIAKARERAGVMVDVDIYEREGYIGGRSTTAHPYNNTEYPAIELGASIFIKPNKNMWRASEEFGLERKDFGGSGLRLDSGTERNLFSGKNSGLGQYWDRLKFVWRYGYTAPTRTQNLVNEMVHRLSTVYDPDTPKWENMTSFVEAMKWLPLTSQTMAEFLDLKGIRRSFSREIVDGATRVNYGQNVDEIHALEGACSMAATGASSVKGGNYQIFQHFIARSGAALHLNTTATAIGANPDGTWTVVTSTGDAKIYRDVIIAAPFHQTGIQISSSTPIASVPPQPYVHLHVTLLSTTLTQPNASYFRLQPGAAAPTTVYTTWEGVREARVQSPPEFNSLSFNEQFTSERGNETVVKIFSKQRVEDEWLKAVFLDTVGWVYRKEWDAYPVLPPTTEFPPTKLAYGLYYVNAFEPVISTMETETIASRGVVESIFSDRFGHGICGKSEPESQSQSSSASEPEVKPKLESQQEETPIEGAAQVKMTVESSSTSEGRQKQKQKLKDVDSDFVYGWDC